MYTETRVFSIQIFRTLFKDTIARGKPVSILEKILKDFYFLFLRFVMKKFRISNNYSLKNLFTS